MPRWQQMRATMVEGAFLLFHVLQLEGGRAAAPRLTGSSHRATSRMSDEILSASDVARELHVSRQTVDRWIRDGKLRARMIKVGQRGTYQIRRSDLIQFVRRWVRDDWG